MNKVLLFFLLLLIVVVSFLITLFHPLPKEAESNNKPRYLCDTSVADCSKNTKAIPKGVCVPGGACT